MRVCTHPGAGGDWKSLQESEQLRQPSSPRAPGLLQGSARGEAGTCSEGGLSSQGCEPHQRGIETRNAVQKQRFKSMFSKPPMSKRAFGPDQLGPRGLCSGEACAAGGRAGHPGLWGAWPESRAVLAPGSSPALWKAGRRLPEEESRERSPSQHVSEPTFQGVRAYVATQCGEHARSADAAQSQGQSSGEVIALGIRYS